MPPAGRRRQAAATTYVSTDGVIPQSALIQRALDDRLAAAEETRLRREQEQLAREQQRSNPPELATGTPYQWTAPPIPTWQANANNIPPSADESIYTREYQAAQQASRIAFSELGQLLRVLETDVDPALLDSREHSTSSLQIIRTVHMYTLDLLGVKRSPSASGATFSPFPPEPFDSNTLPVTLRNFTLAWNDDVRCAYNKKLAELFATSILTHPTHGVAFATTPNVPELHCALQKCFLNYCRHLYLKRFDQLHPPDPIDQIALLRDGSRATRKKTLLRIRKTVCVHYNRPAWVEVLRAATAESQSSDEGEDFGKTSRQNKYNVMIKDWRHPLFVEFMIILSKLYRIYEMENKRVGSPLRLRDRSHSGPRRQTKAAKGHLPKYIYSETQTLQFGQYHVYRNTTSINLESIVQDARALLTDELARVRAINIPFLDF